MYQNNTKKIRGDLDKIDLIGHSMGMNRTTQNKNLKRLKKGGYLFEITSGQTFMALGVYIIICCVYKTLRNKIKNKNLKEEVVS